jgi:hypothetical protein
MWVRTSRAPCSSNGRSVKHGRDEGGDNVVAHRDHLRWSGRPICRSSWEYQLVRDSESRSVAPTGAVLNTVRVGEISPGFVSEDDLAHYLHVLICLADL